MANMRHFIILNQVVHRLTTGIDKINAAPWNESLSTFISRWGDLFTVHALVTTNPTKNKVISCRIPFKCFIQNS
jgi:hypothetical protein